MCRDYMLKLTCSPMTYLAIFVVGGLCATNLCTYGYGNDNAVEQIKLFLDVGIYRNSLTVAAALPFAANFAEEWQSGAALSYAVRKGTCRYAAANIIMCAVSAFVTAFIGMLLFSGIYSLFTPAYEYDGNPVSVIFGQFLLKEKSVIYIVLRTFVFSVSCAAWAAAGMLISAIFPNRYVALCTPLVARYLLERISMKFSAEYNSMYIDLENISISFVRFDSDFVGFMYCTGVFVLISTVCGIAFITLVKRRLQNVHN